ncbi:MAG: sigma-70 family RNA polymerase sigma factor [Bacteroidales bacterium]|nr:MAG: sigma-70 family RNA polymerase sigma factor [Bacteroidales bacterium]
MEAISLKQTFTSLIVENDRIINKICNIYTSSRADFEDLRQEIVYQLWKSYPDFRNDSKVQTWMYRVALNTALYFKRKNKTNSLFLDNHYDIEDDLESDANKNELYDKLFNAIKKLNNLDRAIIFLYLEQHPYIKIGEIVGISEKNVGVKISRIKDMLRKQLN